MRAIRIGMRTEPTAPIPFDCGGTLPQVQRYTDPRFRRVCRSFNPVRLDQADALELVAFLDIVPISHAAWIFHWNPQGMAAARVLLEHQLYYDGAEAMRELNREAMSIEAGLAVLSAMRDGGWKSGWTPDVINMAMGDLLKKGLKRREVAELTGMTLDQVAYRTGGREARMKAKRLKHMKYSVGLAIG